MFGPGLFPGAGGREGHRHRRSAAARRVRQGASPDRSDGRAIYTPYRPEVLGSASASDPVALARHTKNDPWDGRASREEAFLAKLKAASPQLGNRQTSTRSSTSCAARRARAKSQILREATRITGLGIIEAMRDCKPGMHEYELQADAEFVFKKYGAYGAAYFALIATGKNTLTRTITRTPPCSRTATWCSSTTRPTTRTTSPT